MACSIERNKSGGIEAVYAPNKKPSILYRDIRKLDLEPEYAVRIWAQAYTDSFKERYKGALDINGEPVYDQAKDILSSYTDEAFYNVSVKGKLIQLAQKYNMNVQGFMPATINFNALERELKASSLGWIGIKRASTGNYYMTSGGRFYNPFNSSYQLSSRDIPSDARLEAIVQSFLDKIGAKVETVDWLEHNAVAKVDVLNKVIEMVQDSSDPRAETLTEEAVHIMVAMMRGSQAYNNMAREIRNFQEYRETEQEYGELPNYDPRKITEEAIVKLITNLVVDENRAGLFRSWWNTIVGFLRNLFRQGDIAEFRASARRILDNNTAGLSEDVSFPGGEETFYRIKANPERKDFLMSKLKEINDLKIENRDGRYFIASLNKWVRFRVSDKVAQYSRFLYGKREYVADKKDFYTTKGTILHNYNQLIMEAIISGAETINKTDTEALVYNNLKTKPEFKKFQDRKYYSLTNDQWKSLVEGVKHIHKSIVSRDKNATILTEQVIYDPTKETEDIAGTVDIMVIYSDGTIGLYDYKGVRFPWKGDNREYDKLPDIKTQLYDLQISRYKNILKKSWGLTDKDFRESRIIPINMQFRFKGALESTAFDKLEMYRPGLDKDYLREITVGAEQVRKDEDLNVFLNRLYLERDRLRSEMVGAKGLKRKGLNARLDKLRDTINDLVVSGEISGALTDIASVIEDIQNEGSSFNARKLLEYRQFVDLYSDFNVAFRRSLKSAPKEEKKKLLKRIQHYNDLLDVARSLLDQKMIDLANTFSDRELLDGGKVKTGLGRLFDGIGEWNNPVIFTIGTILAEAKEKRIRQLLDKEKQMDEAHEEYIRWASSRGLTGIKAFSPLIRESDGNLITKFDKSFYDDRNTMLEEGRRKYQAKEDATKEVEWFETHYEFNQERWDEDYKKLHDMLKENASYTEKDRKRELRKLEALNPIQNRTAWFAARNFYIKTKDVGSEAQAKYLSKEWQFLLQKGNEAARKYYDMYIEFNREMGKMVGYDAIKQNFVANIHADTIEKMGSLGVFKEFTLFKDFERSLEIRDNDFIYGVVDENGNLLNKIPVLYLDRLKSRISDSEKRTIEAEAAKLYPKGSVDYLNEVDARVNDLQYKKGVKDKSQDLTNSLKLMYRSALDYHYKSEVEDTILLLREIVTLKRYKEVPTDQFNKPILSRITDTLATRMGASRDTEDAIESFVNLHLYGRKIQSKDSTVTIGERTYSRNKLVQLAQNYLSIKSLGLNPILAGASNIGAQINKQIIAKKGIYFGDRSWKEALESYTSGDEKALAAIYFFEPSSRDIAYDRALKKSASAAVRTLNQRNAFALHRGIFNKRGSKKYGVDNPVFGDDNVDNAILISMLKHWVLDSDGKIRSLGDPLNAPKDPKAKTLWELFDPSGETIKLEGVSEKEFVRFRRLVHMAQNRVKGSLTEDQMHQANTQLWGMMLMKFRNWMPGLIKERMGEFRYNPLLESWEEGHFRATASELLPSLGLLKAEQEATATAVGSIFGTMILPTIKNFLSLGLELVSFGYYQHQIDEKKAEFKRKKLLEANPELDPKIFTLEKFIEFRSKQFRAMATELRYLMGLSWLLLGAMSALGWDDEDENLLTYNMYKLARRASLELSFFFSIDSVNEIVSSPLPVMKLLTDFQSMAGNFMVESAELIGLSPENRRDRTPFGYYTLKTLPGINQVLSMGAYFNQNQSKSTFEKIFGDSFFEGAGLLRH